MEQVPIQVGKRYLFNLVSGTRTGYELTWEMDLHIPASNSLKYKRMILSSFKGRLRNNFNVSIAEADVGDKWQRAVIAVCFVNSKKEHIHRIKEKILSFTERFNGADLLGHDMEII